MDGHTVGPRSLKLFMGASFGTGKAKTGADFGGHIRLIL
uniref:Uncharacterized protein n=1 Tax=Lepeophtheirus salmonis TaxID=72036 RepID=A0A0K2UY14_LEPSM